MHRFDVSNIHSTFYWVATHFEFYRFMIKYTNQISD